MSRKGGLTLSQMTGVPYKCSRLQPFSKPAVKNVKTKQRGFQEVIHWKELIYIKLQDTYREQLSFQNKMCTRYSPDILIVAKKRYSMTNHNSPAFPYY